MKRFGKWLLRVLATAAGIALAVFIVRYGWDWVNGSVLGGKYKRATEIISHEMLKGGEMTSVKYFDQAVMESSTKALLIGDVQKVTVPYAYEIGLGIQMDRVTVEAKEDGIAVAVPKAKMIYDSFQVTGEPKVSDFLYPLSKSRYQEMLDAQAKECREKYLSGDEFLNAAWEEACALIRAQAEQWTGEKELKLVFQKGE